MEGGDIAVKIAIFMAGDLNIHHKKWLTHSNGDTARGETLMHFCEEHALRQLGKGPTREQYLLDLMLTDIKRVNVRICAKIADHSSVCALIPDSLEERSFPSKMVGSTEKPIGMRLKKI